MALKKEITFPNGIVIKYHKIKKIEANNDSKKISITVVSYTNDNYRKEEKNNKQKIDRYNELMKSIMTENEKEQPNKEQVVKWSEECNSLDFISELDLSVVTSNYELENIEDMSFSNIYNKLKEIDIFKDSKDI